MNRFNSCSSWATAAMLPQKSVCLLKDSNRIAAAAVSSPPRRPAAHFSEWAADAK